MKIICEGLCHTYDKEILKNINLNLEGHKSIAIIGVSGSGKSTLLRLLSGLERPTDGTILVNNLDVSSQEYKKSIGFVFQNHNLFPHLTLERNISLVLEKTRGFSKIAAKNKAINYLSLLHLGEQIKKLPKNVSGGEAQRAAIARALALDAKIIFLDEPTSSLDPILTDEVLSAIENLKDSGKTFVFVTHVMSFVKDFADYVLYMEEGEIIEQGLPEILDNPKSESLKLFMEKVR